MGLFSETISDLNGWLEGKRRTGDVRECAARSTVWPHQKSIILKSDMGMELGEPSQGSLSLLVWDATDSATTDDEVLVVGPELSEADSETLPLARIVLVQGAFADEYESYRELLEATYDLDLRGVTSRSLPSRQEIWLRISREALGEGLSMEVMGNALVERLKQLDSVRAVRVVFVTAGKDEIGELRPVADRARTILDALVKMYNDMNFECEECENVEICDEVVELRAIHERLKGSK